MIPKEFAAAVRFTECSNHARIRPISWDVFCQFRRFREASCSLACMPDSIVEQIGRYATKLTQINQDRAGLL